jgi:serine/threonine-protein kinase
MDRTAVIAGTSTFPHASDDGDLRDQRDGRGGRALGYALLALAVVAVFVVAALFGRGLFGGGGAEEVAVPDLKGLTVPDARQALRDADLRLGETTPQNHETVPEGNIIDQNPEPRTQLEEGSAVSVTVSSGVAETTVPSLVGLSLDEARQALRDADLEAGDLTQVPSGEPQGTVVRVRPDEGETVPAGSSVDVRYASGSNRVPDVVGRSEGEARSMIEQAGFELGSVTTEETDEAEPGTVVSQSPGARTSSRLGSTVTIVVATAPPEPTDTPPATPTPTETPDATVTPGG